MVRIGSQEESPTLSVAEQKFLERLTEPRTLELLSQLLDRLEDVVYLLDLLEQFLRRGPEVAEAVNEGVDLLRKGLAGMAKSNGWPNLLSTLQRLRQVVESPQVQALFRESVLDPRAVALVGKMAQAMVEASQEAKKPERRLGLVGLLRVLGDPELQPAMRFAIAFAQRFSRALGNA